MKTDVCYSVHYLEVLKYEYCMRDYFLPTVWGKLRKREFTRILLSFGTYYQFKICLSHLITCRDIAFTNAPFISN